MQKKTKETITCKNCSSTQTVKRGFAKNKFQAIQKYQCKVCKYVFTQSQSKNKTYPIGIILKSISTYNLGHSLKDTSNIIEKQNNTKLPPSTIAKWLSEYKNICAFSKLRGQAKKIFSPGQIIESYPLLHNNLPYTFQIHKAKLEVLFHHPKYNNQFTNTSRFYNPLKSYLSKIPTNKFPHHIFKEYRRHSRLDTPQLSSQKRASQIKFSHLNIIHISKANAANKLAKLALNLARSNAQRHKALQGFFITNDSTTIATEIPVYLTKDDIIYFQKRGFTLNLSNAKTPITGHIYILQVRNSLIHILDYKPEAKSCNPIEQLTLYALSLASRTKLDIKSFKCAWFDENSYYEFFQLHAIYKNRTYKNRTGYEGSGSRLGEGAQA